MLSGTCNALAPCKAALATNKEIIEEHPSAPGLNVLTMLGARADVLKTRLDAVDKPQKALKPLYGKLGKAQQVATDQLIPMHLSLLIM